MSRVKLTARSRRSAFNALATEALELRHDYPRRFRNALLCISQNDPQWIPWVQSNLPPKIDEIHQDLLILVEARARALTLRHYKFMYPSSSLTGLIFKDPWPFSDSGSLTPG